MNDQSHSAINTLIDQAVNRAVQTIDNSIPQALLHGAKLAAGNANPSAEVSPMIGALACEFDSLFSPWMEDLRQELREAAAERLLYRADRLDRHEVPAPAAPKPAPKPKPSTNGRVQHAELKGGLG
jgi:hypothetical protein